MVQEGLCVFIPCNFTYDPADADINSKLNAYWSKGGCPPSPLVATNDPKKTIADIARNRFFLSEEVEQGNCSLVINDAQRNDGGEYCFRMEKETAAKFNFPDRLKLTVRELQDPVINFSGKLKANDHVNITCTVPGRCYLKPPHVSCKTVARNFTLSASVSNDTHVHSVFDFTPSVADNKQNLTCAVTYGNGTTSINKETTILLNVTYPPETPVISYEIRRLDNSSENGTDASQITIEEGESVVLYCKAVGNPSANVTWLNGSNNIIADNELKLYKVKTQGDYICLATNSEGSNNKDFRILLKSSGNPTEPSNAVYPAVGALAVIAVIAFIIAIILIFKRYRRKSMMDLESHKRLQTLHSDFPPSDQDPNPIDNDVTKEPEKAEESTDKVPSDPEDLHYASLTFIARQDIPDVIPEEIQTEYAEIKRCSQTVR
nr:sialic acid-binding Ig-like lectin 13 [Anolis sagrei ordinatus]